MPIESMGFSPEEKLDGLNHFPCDSLDYCAGGGFPDLRIAELSRLSDDAVVSGRFNQLHVCFTAIHKTFE